MLKNMNLNKKKSVSAIVSVVLTAALVSCSAPSTTKTSKYEEKPPITLNVARAYITNNLMTQMTSESFSKKLVIALEKWSLRRFSLIGKEGEAVLNIQDASIFSKPDRSHPEKFEAHLYIVFSILDSYGRIKVGPNCIQIKKTKSSNIPLTEEQAENLKNELIIEVIDNFDQQIEETFQMKATGF